MSKQPKKKYRFSQNPVLVALQRAKPIPNELIDKMRIRELSAIRSFLDGNADIDDLETIRSLENLCRASAELGIGPEAFEICNAAREAVHAIIQQNKSFEKIKLNFDEIIVFQQLQHFHDEQRSMANFGEYLRIAELSDKTFVKLTA